ncbi:MAG: PD-(D/E)XK nuclease family protein [Candidatus Marinimicrobia bacterium]|nr:PD-(D/E)XK nuclease family protein [Candidatus Neomarinimicrobiota bacterium]
MNENHRLIEELKKSPLFNMSLSSKELFHSNFIAWVSETYPLKFGKLLSDYFVEKNKFVSTEIKCVHRESRNLDLIIEFESSKLIIENKVKSVPDRQQLIDYKNKSNPNDLFVLLTLIRPPFDTTEIGWEILTYRDLGVILDNLKNLLSDNDSYNKSLLNDYVFFINNLTCITESLKFDTETDCYNFYNSDYGIYKEIRLHDLYIKYKYTQLVSEIHSFLQSKRENIEVLKGTRYSHENHKNKIVISFNFVNGKGVINIDYSNENEIIYGIMLDGIRYNHYLYAWGKKEKEKKNIANNLRQKKLWFSFDFIPENESYPKKGKDFNKFGNSMIYRSAKIKSSTTIKELLNRINTDTIRLQNIKTNANKV